MEDSHIMLLSGFSACLPSLESALSLQKKHCTLLHEGAHAKPEAVEKGEVVFYHIGAWVTRMGVIPLVRAEPVAGTRESSQTMTSVFKGEAFCTTNDTKQNCKNNSFSNFHI